MVLQHPHRLQTGVLARHAKRRTQLSTSDGNLSRLAAAMGERGDQ